MSTLTWLASTAKKKMNARKLPALVAAFFLASSFLISVPIYADVNRVEFNKEISGERKSSNYDNLAGKGEGNEKAGEPTNITSGKGSAGGSVAEGSTEGSTSIP